MASKSSSGKKATLVRSSSGVEKPPAKLDNLLSQLVVWVGFPASWAATPRVDDDREDSPTQNPVASPGGGPIDRDDGLKSAAGGPPQAGSGSTQPLAWVALAFSLPEKKVVPVGPPER